MRILLLVLLLTSRASAQTPAGDGAAHAAPAAHALPFASSDNVLELALGGDADGPLTVAVAWAPTWLVFDQTQAEARTDDAEPVARLSFSVARDAPVGMPSEIVLSVRDASGASVGEKTVRISASAPDELLVETPRPNPSRGAVAIPYALPEAGRVRVSVVDLLGREVSVLVDAEETAGGHTARVPAGSLAAGVYVVRVSAGAEARITRLTVVR